MHPDELLKLLISIELVTKAEIGELLNSIPPAERRDAASLAAELAHRQKITQYQAKLLLNRKWGRLTVGNYLILEPLGRGAMGEVYKARHKRLDYVAAVKLLPRKAFSDRNAVMRFQQEISIAAKLDHQNIVKTLDTGDDNGVYYLTMEYVDGLDLSSYVCKFGVLDEIQAVECICQAARGLEHAHSKGVVHRDIKPANLLVDSSGTVKVADLGLARMQQIIASTDSTLAARLTKVGFAMGTVAYMAPEQAIDPLFADHRADVYSLGCTLYFLLTGKVMYEAKSPIQIMTAHRERAIPYMRASRPKLSEEIDHIFQKMVAKQADFRHRSMKELIDQLDACYSKFRDVHSKFGVEEVATIEKASLPAPVGRKPADSTARPPSSLAPIANARALENRMNREELLDLMRKVSESEHKKYRLHLPIHLPHLIKLSRRWIQEHPTIVIPSTIALLVVVAIIVAVFTMPTKSKYRSNAPSHHLEKANTKAQRDPLDSTAANGDLSHALRNGNEYTNRANAALDHKSAAEAPQEAEELTDPFTLLDEAERQLRSSHPEKAVHALTKLVDQDFGTASVYHLRGTAEAELGHWDRVQRDYQEASKLQPESPWWPYLLGVCLAQTGQGSERRKVYRQMVQQFELAPTADLAERIGYGNVLNAELALDSERLVEIVRFAAKDRQNNRRLLGAALYRHEQYRAALLEFLEAETSFGCRGWDWFFRAMIHKRLDQAEGAHEAFRKGVDWMEYQDNFAKCQWQERVETQLLRREAQALLDQD